MRQRKIKSVVEMGCGDWQFSKDIDWGGAIYHGFDVVPSVITRNQKAYSRTGVSFHLYSGDPAELPHADLLIVKDVLQHLSDAKINGVLPHLKRFTYSLITNCVNPRGITQNTDIVDGDFRYLDLRLAPFNHAAEEVFSFTNKMSLIYRIVNRPRWFKRVLLVTSQSAHV